MNKYIKQAYCLGYQDGHFNGYHSTLIEDGHCDRENSMDDLPNINLVSIDEVLGIIEGFVESRPYPDGGVDYYIEDVDGLIDAVESMKGEQG